LILTENYAALGILQQELLNIKDAIIISDSSFPRDQEYTQYYIWFVDLGLGMQRVKCSVHQHFSKQPEVGDVFIGYHTDTAASVVLRVCRLSDGDDEQILDQAKKILLCCATPESIVRLRSSPLAASYEEFSRAYFDGQQTSQQPIHTDNYTFPFVSRERRWSNSLTHWIQKGRCCSAVAPSVRHGAAVLQNAQGHIFS